MLRVATAGSVDDGKSTLIGRLLFDAKALMADQEAGLKDLANLTDGLRAEREQGITIDVAYRHFATPRRRFVLHDCPGHAQYTRNMVTGASTADLAVILVDARRGLTEQSRRHAALAGLLGVPQITVCVNKMDLVGYSEDRFDAVVREFLSFSAGAGLSGMTFIPVSALHGDNVVDRSEAMPWYAGEPLLAHLEGAPEAAGAADGPARLPVQYVIRHAGERHYAGRLASGTLRAGDEVVVLPSGARSRVARVAGPRGDVEEAAAPASLSVVLEDELDVGRGDMIARASEAPAAARELSATVCWLGDAPARPGASYLLKHTTPWTSRRSSARPPRSSRSTRSAGSGCASEASWPPTRTSSLARPGRSSSSTRRRTTPSAPGWSTGSRPARRPHISRPTGSRSD
jgi:sulfate adenylyltransferase large subunit